MKLLKKIFAIVILLTMLLTSTHIISIAQGIEEELVNIATIVRLSAETKTAKTGEAHKVRIKNSYANPNGEDYAKIKIYLRNSEGNPNDVVEVKGLIDNRIAFTSDNDEDMSVIVELKEEQNAEKNVTNRYLEYTLQPGVSLNIELNFVVPNGTIGTNQTLVLVPEVTHNEENYENDKVGDDLTLQWTNDFEWRNLQKNANVSQVSINIEDKFAQNIVYTFSAENVNMQAGDTWLQSVELTDTIVLPAEIKFPEGITKKENSIYAGDNLLVDITVPEGQEQYYEIEEVNPDTNQLKFKFRLTNPNVENGVIKSNFNPFEGVSVTLYTEHLKVQEKYVSDGTKNIQNDVQAVFYPITNTKSPITLNANKNVKIAEDVENVVFTKTADVTSVKRGGSITYTIKIRNNGRVAVTKLFEDNTPSNLYIATESIEALEADGYTYANSKISKTITVEPKQEVVIMIKYNVTSSTTLGKITNTATYGNLTASATIDAMEALEIENKLIRRWVNYNKNEYSTLVTPTDSYDDEKGSFDLLAEGDRIEYEVTLKNTSDIEQIATIYYVLPSSTSPSNYKNYGYYSESLKEKLSLAQEIGYTQANVQNDFLKTEYFLISNIDSSGPNHTVTIRIPGNTTLKQTYILDVPTGDDYDLMLDAIRYSHGYIPNKKDSPKTVPYNVAYVVGTDAHAIIEHKVEPRYYMSTGVLAINSMNLYEQEKAFIDSQYVRNANYYKPMYNKEYIR